MLPLAVLAAGCGEQQAQQPAGEQAHVQRHDPPVVIDVCGQPARYDRVPQRAVTHDVNIAEMFLFLGLGEKLAGYGGISSQKTISPQLSPWLERVPNLSAQGMNMESLLGVNADFVFAGWGYGFRPGGVTPERLAEHGVASYVLSESCIRVQQRERVALDDGFQDMENVASIFGIRPQAEARMAPLRAALQQLRQQMQGVAQRPRVFVFDSGEKLPTTVGRFGMPQAMMDEAGASNIFADLANNWPKGNWEDVIDRNPEWIIIVDYGTPNAQGKIDFLLQKKELEAVSAIRHRRFFVMSYAEATPGPRNVETAQRLAAALHPERQITVNAVHFNQEAER
ncbi:ABC transporter substrate-binding protein [Comamonas sp. GB3 AK4-5]|uniref:ABC transporter substrate-binding protein n=1 Tax=Comamonas sp. GB3 AK4-5 TaxID=3231487 RepID=UPI00351EFB70